MSAPNIFVSNGTCYTAPGKKLDGSFIPCGNDFYGHQTCCGAGDYCLADKSCFGVHGSGYGSYLTYMAGCSDPDYKDASCPDKHIDQPWVALTLCDNSDGAWAVCSQQGNPSTLQAGSFCSCTDAAKTTVAFKDATSLTNSCSLPQSTGQSIQFFTGHIPTQPPPGTTPASSTQGSSQTSTQGSTVSSTVRTTQTPTPTPTQTPNPSSSSTRSSSTPSQAGTSSTSKTSGSSSSGTTTSGGGTSSPNETGSAGSDTGSDGGLTTGAKIGIGVGVGVGVFILLAVIAALLFLRRRRNPREPASDSAGAGAGMEKPKTTPGRPDEARLSEADGRPVSEIAGKPAPPGSLGRSELAGSHVPHATGSTAAAGGVLGAGDGGHVERPGDLTPVAELPANSVSPSRFNGATAQPLHPGGGFSGVASEGTTHYPEDTQAGAPPGPDAGDYRWGRGWRA